MTVRVIAAGPLTLFQDGGRPGRTDWGLGPAGALDRQAMTSANQMVGNPWDTTVLEILNGGFAAVFECSAVIAITGAVGQVTVAGSPVPQHQPVPVRPGAQLEVGQAQSGMRFYLAVRGGFRAPSFAGSRSRDTLAGMGPLPIAAGDQLAISAAEQGLAAQNPVSGPIVRSAPTPGREAAVRLIPGPRLDWFAPETWHRLLRQSWEVSADSNRIGLRLIGRPLHLAREDQLPSEGTVTGAVQVPPSGLPVIFLADRPVTGGYPVVGVVMASELDLLAQLRPGQQLRFLPGRLPSG